MRTPLSLVLSATSPLTTLRTARFQTLVPTPREHQWFTKLINVNTRRAFWQDIHDSVAFAALRREQPHDITRTHVVACRLLRPQARGFFLSTQTRQDITARPRLRASRHGLT